MKKVLKHLVTVAIIATLTLLLFGCNESEVTNNDNILDYNEAQNDIREQPHNDTSVDTPMNEKPTQPNQPTLTLSDRIVEVMELFEDGEIGEALRLARTLPQTNNEVGELVQMLSEVRLAEFEGLLRVDSDPMSDHDFFYAIGSTHNREQSTYALAYVSQDRRNPERFGLRLIAGLSNPTGSFSWIFPSQIRIRDALGITTIDIPIPLSDRYSEVTNRRMNEWVDVHIDNHQINALLTALALDEEITIRFSGSTYFYDITIDRRQREDLLLVVRYFNALSDVHG